jgi:hypothetical protein
VKTYKEAEIATLEPLMEQEQFSKVCMQTVCLGHARALTSGQNSNMAQAH